MPVYMIRAGEDGPLKIGWSKNVPERQKIIQPTIPVELKLVRVLDVAPWVEGWLHQQFKGLRLLGEWFSFDQVMLTIEPPAEKPAKPPKERRQRIRRGLYPTQIQFMARKGTIAAVAAQRRPGEEMPALWRRVLAEWLAMTSPTIQQEAPCASPSPSPSS